MKTKITGLLTFLIGTFFFLIIRLCTCYIRNY